MEDGPVYLQAVGKLDAALAVQTEVDFVRLEAEPGSYESAYKFFESTNQNRPQNYPVGASVVCASANNCGSDLLALVINPSVMVLDETGQTTSSTMAVPLTIYTR